MTEYVCNSGLFGKNLLLWPEFTLLVFHVYMLQGVRNTLAGEESQVELLKAQLKELFRFSADSRHLSDDVLAVVKEHQRYVTGSLLLFKNPEWQNLVDHIYLHNTCK